MVLRCGDCGVTEPLPGHPDAPSVLRTTKEFLAEHSACSFSVSMSMPLPPAVIDLSDRTADAATPT